VEVVLLVEVEETLDTGLKGRMDGGVWATCLFLLLFFSAVGRGDGVGGAAPAGGRGGGGEGGEDEGGGEGARGGRTV
jgi:hypothetical protein